MNFNELFIVSIHCTWRVSSAAGIAEQMAACLAGVPPRAMACNAIPDTKQQKCINRYLIYISVSNVFSRGGLFKRGAENNEARRVRPASLRKEATIRGYFHGERGAMPSK
jgi:hypothetical protein